MNAPSNWAIMKPGTSRHGKRRAAANAMVTAGLKCAPLTSPKVYIIARMTRPKVTAMPGCVMTPPLTPLMMMAPVPAKTRANVPMDSEASFLMQLRGHDGLEGGIYSNPRGTNAGTECLLHPAKVPGKEGVLAAAILQAFHICGQPRRWVGGEGVDDPRAFATGIHHAVRPEIGEML